MKNLKHFSTTQIEFLILFKFIEIVCHQMASMAAFDFLKMIVNRVEHLQRGQIERWGKKEGEKVRESGVQRRERKGEALSCRK